MNRENKAKEMMDKIDELLKSDGIVMINLIDGESLRVNKVEIIDRNIIRCISDHIAKIITVDQIIRVW